MSRNCSAIRHRHRMLFWIALALAIAALWPLRVASGQPVEEDPARGPYDDRGQLVPRTWTVAPVTGAETDEPAVSTIATVTVATNTAPMSPAPRVGPWQLVLDCAAACALRGETVLIETVSYIASAARELFASPRPRARLIVTPIRDEQRAVPGLAVATRF